MAEEGPFKQVSDELVFPHDVAAGQFLNMSISIYLNSLGVEPVVDDDAGISEHDQIKI